MSYWRWRVRSADCIVLTRLWIRTGRSTSVTFVRRMRKSNERERISIEGEPVRMTTGTSDHAG
jgi:hypothetical protein